MQPQRGTPQSGLSFTRAGSPLRFLFPILVVMLASSAIAWIFYPGFMSYDTIHALRSAREGVTDSMWPPMVSYIWRAVDAVTLNPSAMHFSQVLLLLASVYAIVMIMTGRMVYAALCLMAYLCVPVILGTVAVIWKDVLMASFFLSGFVFILLMRRAEEAGIVWALAMLAFLLVGIGICTRHNAIAGAVPLFALLGDSAARHLGLAGKRRWIVGALAAIAMTISSFSVKSALDRYSLPAFTPLPSSTAYFIRSVRVLDLAGASTCLNQNLLKDLDPTLSLGDIARLYDVRHINLSQGLLERTGTDERVDRIWMSTILKHPICALSNKWHLAVYLTGANSGEQFLITSPSIDPNTYGYQLSPSPIRDYFVTYIVSKSNNFFFRPWLIYLIACVAMAAALLRRRSLGEEVTLFVSGVFYFGSLVGLGNAADARLPFYATSALLIVLFISIVPPRVSAGGQKRWDA